MDGCFLAWSYSFIRDLGSEEVFQHSEVVDLEFNDEGLLLMEAESGEGAQGGGLVEHVQISESELLLDWLSDLEEGLLFLLIRIVLTELDGTRSDLTFNGELDEVARGCDLDSLAQGEELFTDLGELVAVDSDERLVVSLGDGQMLRVNCDEVQVEFSGSQSLGVLESDLQVSGIIVSLQCDGVRVVSELHDLSQVSNGDTEDHAAVSSVVLKAVHA